jgi:hypothetical protein
VQLIEMEQIVSIDMPQVPECGHGYSPLTPAVITSHQNHKESATHHTP